MQLLCLLFAAALCLQLTVAWRVTSRAVGVRGLGAQRTQLWMSEVPPSVDAVAGIEVVEESKEEKYKREKLAEIAEKKAQEVFISRGTGRWECQACGYIYAESQGYEKRGILPGTAFAEIETFRCPQCGANKKYFVAETEVLSGFKENQKYGFGGNTMTANAKTNLIFGGLFAGFLVFMGGYLLE